MRIRRWVKDHNDRQEQQLHEKIAEEQAALVDHGDQKLYKKRVQHWTSEYARLHVRIAPRTWTWWFRWALTLLVIYFGTSYLVYALRHPEMTNVEHLLDFWRAMTWQ